MIQQDNLTAGYPEKRLITYSFHALINRPVNTPSYWEFQFWYIFYFYELLQTYDEHL